MPSIHDLFPGLRSGGRAGSAGQAAQEALNTTARSMADAAAAVSPTLAEVSEAFMDEVEVEPLPEAPLSVGDSVEIATTSQYYNSPTASNPRSVGVISRIGGDPEVRLSISVFWDGGPSNTYRLRDLVRVTPAPTPTTPIPQIPLPRFHEGDVVQRVRGGNFGPAVQVGSNYLVLSVDPDGLHMMLQGMTGGGTSMRHFDLVDMSPPSPDTEPVYSSEEVMSPTPSYQPFNSMAISEPQRAVRWVAIGVHPDGSVAVYGAPALTRATALAAAEHHRSGNICIHIMKTETYETIERVEV